jgi:hypothetical protein
MGIERIVIDPKILVGKPVVKGTRLVVDYSVIPKLPPPRHPPSVETPGYQRWKLAEAG